MTIRRSCGPFGSGNNASVVTSVIETDEDVVLDECGSVVCVIGDGEVTVTLPDGAPGGTEVLVLAESGSARVLGPVAGGPQTAGLSLNFAAEDAAVTFDADFMFEGGHFECNGGRAYIAALAVFDSPSDHGIHVHAGTGTLLVSGDFGLPRLWGAGNAGHGVDVQGGADLLHPLGFLPTITGALGDFTLGGNASSRSWDDTLGAYTAPFANTWANLAAVPGQDAHNVAADAHIVVDTP